MKIHFATDHAGFELKNTLLAFVRDELGYEVVDHGAYDFDARDDYPEFIRRAAKAVSENPEDARAIVLGGSGSGEVMVANKLRGVRAFQYYGGNLDIVKLSREHNDANTLSLGGRFISPEEAQEAVRLWLRTPFSGEDRHQRRVRAIEA